MTPCHLTHEERIKTTASTTIQANNILVVTLFAHIKVSITTRQVCTDCTFTPCMRDKTGDMVQKSQRCVHGKSKKIYYGVDYGQRGAIATNIYTHRV